MCVGDNCCFCIPPDLGCLILGFTTFIFSSFLSLTTIILVCVEHQTPGRGLYYLQNYPQIQLTDHSINIILYSVLLVAILWMGFSVMLLIGIRKNKSSFVLSYFSFSLLVTILGVLSVLLVLLIENNWILALVLAICSLLNMHGLVVVHTTYNLMLSGTKLKFSRRRLSDEAILVDDDVTDERL